MIETNNAEKNSDLIIDYINLLNYLFSSLEINPLNTLNDLSNDSLLYSLIIEIEPNFESIFINNLVLNIEDSEIKYNNLNLLLNSIDNYIKENQNKDKIKEKIEISENISIKKIINGELDELIKLAEILIFLTIICKNKDYFLQKMNQIDNNNINKLYYSIIQKYMPLKIKTNENMIDNIKPIEINIDDLIFDVEKNEENINENISKEKDEINNLTKEITKLRTKLEKMEQEKNILKNNNIIKSKKFSEDLSIQKKEIIYNQIITSKNDDLIESLKNENEDLHKTLDNLHIENQELEALVEKLNIKIKESDLDYQKLKEEYDIKEQNFAEVISNHKSMIEKLNHDLKLEININKSYNEEKEQILKEINKYKEELENKEKNDELIKKKKNLEEKDKLIKELEEKNKENEKEKMEENNYYKKSYEEQKIRVNEEHKLISESLYKLAIHFMTLKEDLQNRINLAKKNSK